MKRNWGVLMITAVVIFFGCISCEGSYTPKPRGNFRLDLPEKHYVKFDTTFPYSFEYPSYAKIQFENNIPGEHYWINILFPRFKGELHLTYKELNNDLFEHLNDAYEMANKHMQKATAIRDNFFEYPQKDVYGITYQIEGVGAASPYQFVITDSTKNFIRGALYFNLRPNNDSLAPVIDYIEKDINHMIESFEWTDHQKK